MSSSSLAPSPNSLDILDSQIDPKYRDAYSIKLHQYHLENPNCWEFSIVPGMFKQSDPDTDESKFNYLDEHFGKIGSWDAIVERLNQLNSESCQDEQYKILFLFRHYAGYHNLAHLKYGDDAWNNYWSKINGDDEMTWGPDANLTMESIETARKNSKLIAQELSNNNASNKSLIMPNRLYVSPLSRAIDTLYYTWDPILDLKKVQPKIQENWRETMGIHTCDKRSTRSIINQRFTGKGFEIESSLTEEDELYQDDYRETVDEQAMRMNSALQELFSECGKDESIIGITSHSGSIRTQLMVLGHRSFAVQTGGMVPVFVKALRRGNIEKL
ncbi:PMU3 [Candida oxycetoniae]|uniref:PMU3 n=1 Tax=Candida oxycetoniae TaxID=497107 RepID=A0AAI9STL8_9ASCO|nr:PMU3 [Candida oxycetoniae]KAI3402817.2 PMU3 [Candida oxycetoniae]